MSASVKANIAGRATIFGYLCGPPLDLVYLLVKAREYNDHTLVMKRDIHVHWTYLADGDWHGYFWDQLVHKMLSAK